MEWFQEETLHFQLLPTLKVDQRRRLIRPHSPGPFNPVFDDRLGYGRAQGRCDAQYLSHELSHQTSPRLVGEQLISRDTGAECCFGPDMAGNDVLIARGSRYTESIKGNVPDELFPVRFFEVVSDLAAHTSPPEQLGIGVSSGFGGPLELAQDDVAMGSMPDDAGSDAIQADE